MAIPSSPAAAASCECGPSPPVRNAPWLSPRKASTVSRDTFSFARIRSAMLHLQRIDSLGVEDGASVPEAGTYVLWGQARVVAKDLFFRPSLGQQVHDELHRQTCSLY